MRSWVLCLGASMLVGMANAGRCISPICGSPKCLSAVGADPLAGELFCSSWLSLAPATTTVTATEATTSTLIHVETALTTVALTTGTTTMTVGVPTTIYQKRVPTLSSAANPAENIVSLCSSIDSRISKACSCFLSTATPSTVTALTTTMSTAVVESTSIVSSTVTNNVVETVSVAAPAVTIPPNVLINGGFETYVSTGNILPWDDTSATTGGRVEIVNGVNPCTTNGYCAGGRVVVRVYPPTSGSGYIGLRETFNARPSTSYSVSFLYRCLNFDINAAVEVWYDGVFRGSASCPAGTSAPFLRATGIQFTTDSKGRGELQIRFTNPSNLPYLYLYADDFQATAA
ncbi:hypothetical protein GE09DRAFT_1267761 [Coniochaeta sp. 2T2.1]|nr:hypothetical protein GE09DRAFT_1267761 [Coniochaeta sp. 2T2.1]